MISEELPLQRSCGATAAYYRMLEIDPNFQTKQRDLELFTAQAKMLGGARSRINTVKIPVIVHVIYNKPVENISDAQVKSQIKVLNKDFRKKNTDISKIPAVWKPLAADAKIEFHLTKDYPAIQRVQTAKTRFGFNDSVKFAAEGGADAIKPDKILNIWVCNLPGLLGYAQFPGGIAETDGVVVNYKAFGTSGTVQTPFNLGRTATHEVGHWLNLRHIWGDTQDCSGTDHVDDTPKALEANYSTPTFPHVTCNNGPNGDMFVNYMDYVDDKAMFMFTQGQVERMAATFLGPRSGFVP